MHHSHGLVFVALSVLVAVAGSWTALDLFRRVRSHFGAARRNWLAAAALAMGAAIWSMHFIAMLGFDPGSPVRYDPGLTALSLALAIGSTAGAFFVAGRETARGARFVFAGAAMGLGICLMHYVGMAALRSAVSLGYDGRWVAASVLVAVTASTTALLAARRESSAPWRAAAATILGLAIVSMHYTAMAGVRLTPGPDVEVAATGAPPFTLAVTVAAATTGVLVLALLASLYDQRLNVLAALDSGGVGYWELAFPAMTLQASERALRILGVEPGATLDYGGFVNLIHDEDRVNRDALLRRLQDQGAVWDLEYRLKESPTVVAVRGRLHRDSKGAPRRMHGVIFDVTERRRAFDALAQSERRQKLLIEELNHRVKNTLATVQSLALQTAKGSDTVDAFRADLEKRLIALSRTHDALTRGYWESASLQELADAELKPYVHGRASVAGPPLALTPREALSIGMTLHELATNAAKYGALSTPLGTVTVEWRAGGDGEVILLWTERGGPTASAPARRGFGSRLIESSVRHELGGSVVRDFDPEGLRCEIRFRRPRVASDQAA